MWVYGETIIPAGTQLHFSALESVFTGDISACGDGGFFLVIEGGTGQDLIFGEDQFDFPPETKWFIFEFGSNLVTTASVLSWRAGCYTKIEGPVPAFTAVVRFSTRTVQAYS